MQAGSDSLLEYALLGLLRPAPASGYSLRKVFATSAMGSFSDSPGAIYPALKRLEKAGQIVGDVEESAGLRHRKIYRLTAKGRGRLDRWIRRPLAPRAVVKGMGGIMLQFAFCDPVSEPKVALRLLNSLHSQLNDYVAELEAYFAAHEEQMPVSGRLALAHGIQSFRSSLEWTVGAIAACKQYERSKS
ncbi:MAG TPA: PadR family transcriptional regulator [Acidisarcina sp.]